MTHTPDAPDVAAAPDRRRMLGLLSKAFLGLWGLGGLGVLGAYLGPRGGHANLAERIVKVGAVDEFRVGEGRLVRHGVTPFFVVRLDREKFVALSAICTHVRCILEYDARRKGLVCPCHEGRFDLSGNVVSGPPPRPLTTYAVAVRAGDVYVQL